MKEKCINEQSVASRVLYEDNHVIIVNKLPCEIVQSDKSGDNPLEEKVKSYIKEKYQKPGKVFLGVVHRLDRPVSGALLFARTSKALTRLNAMLQEHLINKTYWAVVGEKPLDEEGTLKHYLVRNETKNKSYVNAEPTAKSKEAILDYKLIKASDKYYLLEILLHTGRHHQIRAQLASIGSPIKGDLKYGYARSNKDASIHLHAISLSFIHPVSNELISVTAQPPDDVLWNYFYKQ